MTTVTNDQLSASIAALKATLDTFTSLVPAWCDGVAGGGPNSDGRYPFPNSLGGTSLVKCVAQLAADSQKVTIATGKIISIGFSPGFNSEGNSQYTFKASDNGGVFYLLSNNNAANNTIKLIVPTSLPVGWAVLIVQAGLSPLRVYRSDDTSPSTNAGVDNRQGFYTTAGKGSMMPIMVEPGGLVNVSGDVGPNK
ncbi:hypothetical protein [Sphingomonas sp. GC_Shp_3]|uniref:hypothetical protein n=1 Tax=Sphingomonas sp. GC_Shp_3 TaxID=2937383 RepID=UPI00226AF121|nr:hypothetical protein [Sphingomonas sp. GC_Shp_3]